MKTKLTAKMLKNMTDAELAAAKIQAKYTIDDDRIAAEQIRRWTRAQKGSTPDDEPADATITEIPDDVPADAPAAPADATNAKPLDRRAAYDAIVLANRTSRNTTRTSRFDAVKTLLAAGHSMPAIATELNLTYRQVKHAAWYVQHPDVPMPTR